MNLYGPRVTNLEFGVTSGKTLNLLLLITHRAQNPKIKPVNIRIKRIELSLSNSEFKAKRNINKN